MRSSGVVDFIGIVIIAALVALAVSGCSLSQCIRHSDCPAELICSSVGRCELPPPDGDAGTDGGDTDGGDVDGGTSDLGEGDLGSSPDLTSSPDLLSSSDLPSSSDLVSSSDLATDTDMPADSDMGTDSDMPSSSDMPGNDDLFTVDDMASGGSDLPVIPPRAIRPPWQILTPPPPGTIKPGIFPVDTVPDMAPFDLFTTDVRAVSP